MTAIPATAARAARTLVRSPGFWWLSVAAVAAVDAYAALSRPADERLTDLAVYTGAVSGWRSGASLYAFAAPDGAPFTYPPFAGMVLRPLAYLAEVPAQVAWTLATIGTVIAVAALVARRLDRRPTCRATTAAWQAPAVATALLLSTPVSSNLRFGQVSVVLGALVLADTLLLRGRRYHGTLIGIAAALKLTPLIFIPMLWLAGQRRAAAVAVTTFGAGGALAWLVLPGDSRLFFRDLVWHAGRLGHITTGGNQSVNGALLRLSVAGPARTFAVLALATVVGVAALSRAARLARCGAWLSATTIVGSASVAVSPVSWTHHQVWLVLAALLPVAGSTRRRYAWAGLVLAVMILPVTALTPLVCGEARMLLAVAVAALVPLSVGEATRPDEVWIVSTGRRPGPGPLPAIRSIAANDRHPGVTDIRG